jgi:hypothetical protein
MHLSPDGDAAESPEKKKRGAGRKGRDDEMVSNGEHGLARAPSPPNVSCTSGLGSTLSWTSRRSHVELFKLWVPPGLMDRSKPNE